MFVSVVILSLYLTDFVVSSLTVGTFKCACMTLLDIYCGAFYTIHWEKKDVCKIRFLRRFTSPN